MQIIMLMSAKLIAKHSEQRHKLLILNASLVNAKTCQKKRSELKGLIFKKLKSVHQYVSLIVTIEYIK